MEDITINFGEKNVVDLMLVNKIIESQQNKTEEYIFYRDFIRHITEIFIKIADLKNVRFEISNPKDFTNIILSTTLDSKYVQLITGSDEKYDYSIVLKPDLSNYEDFSLDDEDNDDFFEDEDDDDCTENNNTKFSFIEEDDDEDIIFETNEEDLELDIDEEETLEMDLSLKKDYLFLIRIKKDDKTVFENFSLDTKEWEKVNPEILCFMTPKQLEMISENKNSMESALLKLYITEYGNISDKKFETLLKENAEIIELAKATSKFMNISLRNESKFVLSPKLCSMGTLISFKKGFFNINCVDIEDNVTPRVKIKDFNEIYKILNGLFNQYLEDLIAIIPLSDSAFGFVNTSGLTDVYYIKEHEPKITPSEEKILKKYLEKLVLFLDEM